MAAPAGTTGGTGPTPPVDGEAAPEKPDPRRKRPEGMTMTDFLMQIGRENRPPEQDANRRYVVNVNNQIQEALRLEDIFQQGTTEATTQEEAQFLGPGNFPIYQFLGTVGYDRLLFTEDPAVVDVAWGRPPEMDHQPGQVHSGMEHALWAGYCYDHAGEGLDTLENYEDLCRGIVFRYAGENQTPEFVLLTGYEQL
ncbi:MAG: hypothetical protein ACRCWB_01065 [Enterovibrio sp.]